MTTTTDATVAASTRIHNGPQGLTNVTGQARSLVDQFVLWVRNDSLQALIGIGIGVALFLLLATARHFGCRIIGKKTDGWRSVAYSLVKKTNAFFLAMLSADFVAHFVAPPSQLNTAIDFLFTIAAVIQGAVWIRELLLGFVEHRASGGEPGDHLQLHTAMGMIRLLVNFVVWSLALILVLDNLGVNVTALVAGLGIGGIAIGLAAQGIFADLFAALAILFDRPFRLGDTIKWNSITGKVEAIGLKTTRVRSVTGEQVVVANRKLLDQDIFNLRRIDERRVTFLVPVTPGLDADKLAAIPDLVKAVVEGEENTRHEHAHLLEVTPNGLNIEVQFYMTVPEAAAMSATRHKVIVSIKRAFDGAGIALADLTPPR
jgi:small-conductance mechanosensitive channel